MRTWGSAYLRAEVVRDTMARADKLVADGPFRHVRNPLYFGSMLTTVGIGLLCSRRGWFALVAGTLLFLRRLIGYEEGGLLEAQGESYRAYMTAPRFWPALRAPAPAGSVQPRWLPAFFGEGWLWLLGAAGVVLAVTLNSRLYIKLDLACAAFLALVWVVGWKRRSPR